MTTVPLARPAANVIELDTTFLPIAQMRQISRVTSISDGTITGEMDLTPQHWVWPQHFPGDPVFPGTLLIEAAGQLVALWAWAGAARGRPRLVRTTAEFHSPVGLGISRLQLEGAVRRRRNLYFGNIQLWSSETHVASVEAVLVVLPPS
jgi:3-hydroxymyristoyl/3-hydroxydecanoyl-(acyl carrier protein) dehydratase